MPPNRLLANLAFTRAGQVSHMQSGAWSAPEDGHTWALTPCCALSLPVAQDAEDAVILLELWPQTAPPVRPTRTMRISRDGRPLAELTLAKRGTHLVALGAVYAGSPVNLDFAFDAPVPGPAEDPRPFAFAFRSIRMIARMPSRELANDTQAAPYLEAGLDVFLSRFLSLGHCCDFGSFQAKCGADTLGLLRYGSIDTYNLVDALIDRFAALGQPGTLEVLIVEEEGGKYWMFDRVYGMSWHTGLKPDETTPAHLIRREMRRLPKLRDMFIEILDGGQKIFILRRPTHVHLSEAEAIAETLRLHGDCTLLWAVQEDSAPGSVEKIRPYLLRGHLDIAERRGVASTQAWAGVCANAFRLLDDERRRRLLS